MHSTRCFSKGTREKLKIYRLQESKGQQTTPMGQNESFNASTCQKELEQNNIIVPPSYDPIDDDVPLSSKVAAIQDIQTNEIR